MEGFPGGGGDAGLDKQTLKTEAWPQRLEGRGGQIGRMSLISVHCICK